MHVPSPLPVRILTHNIRYAKTPPLFPGESPWSERCGGLVAQLQLHTAHHPAPLICLQEVLHPQLQDILSALNASGSWSHLGVGRDNGKTAGEYSLILYQPSVFEVLSVKTRWLSPHPHRPGSKYPDAGSPRLVTAARLQHRDSGQEMLVMSTHLDDQSSEARLFAAGKLLDYAKEFSEVDGYKVPVVLAGDLNSEVHEEAYRKIAGAERGLVDTWTAASYNYGSKDTFTGFRGKEKHLKRIDFVFAHPVGELKDAEGLESRGRWALEGAGVLPNVFDDNVYVSDHRAVVADLLLRRD